MAETMLYILAIGARSSWSGFAATNRQLGEQVMNRKRNVSRVTITSPRRMRRDDVSRKAKADALHKPALATREALIAAGLLKPAVAEGR